MQLASNSSVLLSVNLDVKGGGMMNKLMDPLTVEKGRTSSFFAAFFFFAVISQ